MTESNGMNNSIGKMTTNSNPYISAEEIYLDQQEFIHSPEFLIVNIEEEETDENIIQYRK